MSEKDIERILVIRFSSLGDVVLSTAIFPNLRLRFPKAEIDVLTKEAYADVFNGNPHISHVRLFCPEKQPFYDLVKEIRLCRYDIIIDLHGNFRSWFIRLVSGPPMAVVVKKRSWSRRWLLFSKHAVSALDKSVRERILDCLSPLSVEVTSKDTQLFPRHEPALLKMFDLPSDAQLFGLAPGAAHRTKQWGVEQYASAANRLGAFPNSLIVIVGDKKDQAFVQQLLPFIKVPYRNLTGWTSITELIAIVSKFSFLLVNDSGVLHVAEALKIPLVALFGPTVKGFGFFPYRSTSRVVEVGCLPCRPCSLHGEDICPLSHHRCMNDIDVNAVLLAASDAMGVR